MLDRYGLPLSTSSPAAADAYVLAVDNLLSAGADLAAGFEAALAPDPGFALAEIGRARCHATYGRSAEARSAAQQARTLVAGATRREQSHVNALALQIEGRGGEALAAIIEHLAQFPRDAMVLQPATGIFGLIGFSGRQEREAEQLALLDRLAPHYGEDWWFGAAHAFAECEAGRLDDAARRVERALATRPGNGNAAHVRAHVHYELNEADQGAAFLRAWLPGYAPASLLRGHLSWHLALVEFGLGNTDAAWQLYDNTFGAPLHGRGQPTPPLNVLTDAASWLWRTELLGASARDDDWPRIADYARASFPKAGVVFGDLHTALAYARTGDAAALDRLGEELAALGRERPAFGATAAFAAGFAAYAQGDWHAAADALASRHLEAVRVGGSHAQRELIDRTLVSALRLAGRAEAASALLTARPQASAGV